MRNAFQTLCLVLTASAAAVLCADVFFGLRTGLSGPALLVLVAGTAVYGWSARRLRQRLIVRALDSYLDREAERDAGLRVVVESHEDAVRPLQVSA